MSRIGRLPVTVPSNVKVDIQGNIVKVQGPQGEMSRQFSPSMDITLEDSQILIKRPSDVAEHRALHGTTRALINNMVTGVSNGFDIVLEIEGVGYRAEMDGDNLVLYVGYSHLVVVEPPAGIKFEVDTKTRQVKLHGKDKEQVGQIAAIIRSHRPPEPYHGKGIRYAGEKIRRKAGKSGKAKK
ncbi:MAG: 50S ribosomal protein L6 [Anaerolinea sp.]|nr:50S ribosomal protein L6 [Anaerolinea sp.]